jgi:hypothetical protein
MRSSLGSAPGFAIQDISAKWLPANEQYVTLGVFHDENLVSTMRLEWVFSGPELYSRLASQEILPFSLVWPIAFLTKAGTRNEVKAAGLNSLLRYLALKIALTWKARYLVGTMVEGSPRIFTMKEMGYEFIKNSHGWNGDFISARTPLIAWLDLEMKSQQAISYLEERVCHIINEYQIQIQPHEFEIIPNISTRRD